jgi:hypothetical protein
MQQSSQFSFFPTIAKLDTVVFSAWGSLKRIASTMAESKIMKTCAVSQTPGNRLTVISSEYAEDCAGDLWTSISSDVRACLVAQGHIVSAGDSYVCVVKERQGWQEG